MRSTDVVFVVINGKPIPYQEKDRVQYEMFQKSLSEGDKIEVFLTHSQKEDASLNQLAKLHVLLRELGTETGHTMGEMKGIVKRRTGLYETGSTTFKSFGKCSKEELSRAIETCIEIGNMMGYKLD